jgi:hypothetical protein
MRSTQGPPYSVIFPSSGLIAGSLLRKLMQGRGLREAKVQGYTGWAPRDLVPCRRGRKGNTRAPARQRSSAQTPPQAPPLPLDGRPGSRFCLRQRPVTPSVLTQLVRLYYRMRAGARAGKVVSRSGDAGPIDYPRPPRWLSAPRQLPTQGSW